MVLALALPHGEAPDVKVVSVEASPPVGAAVCDFELHLTRRHRLAAHGARCPAPRSAPRTTRFHRRQLSTLDGFPGFLSDGVLVFHIYNNAKQVRADLCTVRKSARASPFSPVGA